MSETPPPMTKEETDAMLRSFEALKQAQAPAPAVVQLVTPERDIEWGQFVEIEAIAKLAPEAPAVTTIPLPEGSLQWPPGFAGEIARYVHAAAMRPVVEVAVIAALGLLAGICGRQWQIPKSGLNIYIILLARSAIGKEAMHSGISEIVAACSKQHPTAGSVVDFTEYASGPALIKGCIANPCFVNVSGEIGRRIKRLAEDKRDAALQTLRTQLTNLYQKSGATSVLGGISYSAVDNNVASVTGVAYSLIGETTPGTFLDSLTSEMMEDGFMSRFTMIEYDGERPAKNRTLLHEPPKHIVSGVLDLITQAHQMLQQNQFQLIDPDADAEAKAMLDQFDLECDGQINATKDEARRQMWNRAHLKALRIAALLAVADNYIEPKITQSHTHWAITLIRRDIATFTKRLNSGDVGSGDDAREGKVANILREYLTNPIPASYKVSDAMRQNSIVPLHYLQKRTARASAFYSHPLKANRALEDTLRSLIAGGYLIESQKDKVVEAYHYHGKAYRVVRLPAAE